jgi:hypothetical protein
MATLKLLSSSAVTATTKLARNNLARAQTSVLNEGGIVIPTKKKKKSKPVDPHARPQEQPPLPQERPGKKKLRKLRYQQQQMSPREFMLTSAESLQFTGSIVLHKPSSLSEQSVTEQLPTESIEPLKIVVRTSSSFSTGTTGSKANHNLIEIQPLLILDINGILCHRVRKSRDTYDPSATYRPTNGTVANTPIIARPFLQEFLSFLQAHFTLAVWTSAKKKTATQLINRLVPLDIADRFLFVWAQHDCHVQQAPPEEGVGSHTHPQDVLFEKNLSKVWQAYPLWNAHNTLLMDDSPEKCVAVKHNAIHPPPLHGREMLPEDLQHSKDKTLLSDEANVAYQLRFMQQLAQHWKDHPLVQEWDEEGGDSVFVSARTQADFLRDHGGDYRS